MFVIQHGQLKIHRRLLEEAVRMPAQNCMIRRTLMIQHRAGGPLARGQKADR